MLRITFAHGSLSPAHRAQLSQGFETHSHALNTPEYEKKQCYWSMTNEPGELVAALTASTLWDWLYIDELWVDEQSRGQGLGKALMDEAAAYATEHALTGMWLWTQSWQAPQFYASLGFIEFARFEDFPKGHARIGLRKYL